MYAYKCKYDIPVVLYLFRGVVIQMYFLMFYKMYIVSPFTLKCKQVSQHGEKVHTFKYTGQKR